MFDPSKIYHELFDAGKEWAEAEYQARLLEDSKKSLLAQLKVKSLKTSDAASETEALASPEYREFLDGMNAARRDANKSRVKYDSLKVLAELRRTEQSNRRAELENLGST